MFSKSSGFFKAGIPVPEHVRGPQSYLDWPDQWKGNEDWYHDMYQVISRAGLWDEVAKSRMACSDDYNNPLVVAIERHAKAGEHPLSFRHAFRHMIFIAQNGWDAYCEKIHSQRESTAAVATSRL
jgi:hypothetical protein